MKYRFREIQTSWGIAIDIDLEFVSEANSLNDYVQITSQVFLKRGVLTLQEITLAKKGLELIREDCISSPIAISNVSFNPCDYQEEGLPWAIAFAISELLEVSPPSVEITFDGQRYSFVSAELPYK